MPPALLAHSFIRGDHDDGSVRARRAGDHILQEFHVAGRIDDNVTPVPTGELNLRCVDGNVLLLFFRKRIEKKGVLEGLPLRRAALANAFDLSFRERISLRENAPDQRGLAVIDVTNESNFQPW